MSMINKKKGKKQKINTTQVGGVYLSFESNSEYV